MSTIENNRRRIDRMDTWIAHAEEASGDDKAHLRFLFYWIAYEAAYQTYEIEESEGGHGNERVRLHRKLADHDRGRLQSLSLLKQVWVGAASVRCRRSTETASK